MTISPRARQMTVNLLRPPERLKISEWADRRAWIPSEGNAEPGKYRLSRMPHQAAMLDDPIEPGVREVYWMLASQAGGKTLCLILICEFIIEQLKKSILMVRATKDTAIEWLTDKLLPTVEATPCMTGLLADPRKRGSNSRATNRKFPGGSLKIVGAKSPASFRGSSVGKVLQDEIDSYLTTKEGDACALADRAAITFSDAWKIKASTPTLKDFSRIDAGYQKGDQQKYFLPCVCCGAFQWLKDEQLKFSFTAEEHSRFQISDCKLQNEGAPAAVANGHAWEVGDFPIRDTRRGVYVCEVCHHGWTDAQRIAAYRSGHVDNAEVVPLNHRGAKSTEGEGIDKGSDKVIDKVGLRAEWRATAPFRGIRSRQLSGMYLTIGLKEGMVNYLHQFAEDFLEAKRGGRETLMVWWNIFKCEAFEDAHEKMDWKDLQERAEDYGPYPGDGKMLPAQVVWIAFGADVQADRIEFLFYGWGEGQETWALERHAIYGDFDLPSTQERVADYLLNKRFPHPVLGELGISAGAIDSGHQTKVQAVYQFCAKHALHNFWSVKGFDNALGAIYQRAKEKVYGGQRFNLNTDYLKNLIFDRLKNKDPGPRFIHFPKEFDASFYLQLCSEKRVLVRQPKGGFSYQWMKKTSSTRNEVLDMTVYAFGVFEVCRQVDWIARKWREVQQKLRELNPVATPIVIGAPREEKVPGLETARPKAQGPKPGRRKIRINSPFGNRFGPR